MDRPEPRSSESILLFTPFGKDAEHLQTVLRAQKFETCICRDMNALSESLATGGVIITTEEVLASADAAQFRKALKSQPSWSSIPIIAFYGATSENDAFEKKAKHPFQEFAEITFIQRPVSATILVNAVAAALTDRKRQYQIANLLGRLESEIAQREKYEIELITARRSAENASLTKSQFLANMSHEIRTPIGAIMGFLGLLKDQNNSQADVENYISVISRNSVHLLRLIDDILDLSKVEAGQMPIEGVEISLADIVADITSLMGFKARDKGVFFDLSVIGQIPAYVISDPTRLRQILTNVLGNAVKFTDRGRVQLEIIYEKGELTFTVQDTGPGISHEAQLRLFRPFAQADSSTTRQFGGTGLGLVLTRHLTEAMGGSFKLAQSVVGEGSTFVAKIKVGVSGKSETFDQTHLQTTASVKSQSRPDTLAGLKILVVEDSPDNQALFTILLSKMGATIDMASDGSKGVDRAMAGAYDIILMDVQMPEMDGHEATRKLRSKGVLTPIIALTAHAMKEEQERTRVSGFTDFLSKPVQKEALISMILAHTHH